MRIGMNSGAGPGRRIFGRVAALIVILGALSVVGMAQDSNLSELAWLAGHWSNVGKAGLSEEVWLEPLGGLMLGVNRQKTSSGGLFYEFLRIEASSTGVFYVASPRGQTETRFRLTEVEGKRAVFENPDHDFPKRITYWLDDEDRLNARIEGDSGEDSAQEWFWSRREAGKPSP